MVNDVHGRRTTEVLESVIGTAFALRRMRGERVPKQTSAEATNGKLVST